MITLLLCKILLAHLLGDFLLQPGKWVKDKERRKIKSPYLYFHVGIHFLLLMAILHEVRYIGMVVFIGICHLIIDSSKLLLQKPGNKRLLFLTDQAFHLLVILAAVWIWEQPELSLNTQQIRELLITGTALFWLGTPVSILIKILLSQWEPYTGNSTEALETPSLQNAGKIIGIAERILTFIFILAGQWAAIGFLITAKSVFRFGDLKAGRDRKLTEYILIGTLLSFGIAVVTGIMVTTILRPASSSIP